MKTCHFREKIIDYLEGCLSEKDRVLFEEHIKTCSVCQRDLLELKNLYQVLNSADAVVTPESVFFDSLRERIHKQEIALKRPKWKYLGILAPIFGMLILVLFLQFDKRNRSFEITISTLSIMQDRDFNALLLERLIDSELAGKFGVLEEYFYKDIGQGLEDLGINEIEDLLRIVNERYGEKYL